jgi:hypothetical protein
VLSIMPRPPFTSEKTPPVPPLQEAGWALEPMWTQSFIKIQQSKISCFATKTNSLHFDCHVTVVLHLVSDCAKAHCVMLESKLYFHCSVHFVFSQEQRPAVLSLIIYNCTPLDGLVALCIALIRSKLEYDSVVSKM